MCETSWRQKWRGVEKLATQTCLEVCGHILQSYACHVFSGPVTNRYENNKVGNCQRMRRYVCSSLVRNGAMWNTTGNEPKPTVTPWAMTSTYISAQSTISAQHTSEDHVPTTHTLPGGICRPDLRTRDSNTVQSSAIKGAPVMRRARKRMMTATVASIVRLVVTAIPEGPLSSLLICTSWFSWNSAGDGGAMIDKGNRREAKELVS